MDAWMVIPAFIVIMAIIYLPNWSQPLTFPQVMGIAVGIIALFGIPAAFVATLNFGRNLIFPPEKPATPKMPRHDVSMDEWQKMVEEWDDKPTVK